MPDAIAVDLTSFRPSAIDDAGRRSMLWPSFCLPWFRGEPPLVGEAARLHRRASQLVEPGSEWALDLLNRGRYHLAEGWLAMTRVPDSLEPSGARISWTPPGEAEPVSILFSQVVEALLAPRGGVDVDLALVVPDALGPGPREDLLSHLDQRFRSIQFVPRTIAAAMSWCESASGMDVLHELEGAPGGRLGKLLVTTTAADTWEAALVPIRVEDRGAGRRLCPVHERTKHGSELGVTGLGHLQVPEAIGEMERDRLAWHSWLHRAEPTHATALPPQQAIEATEVFRRWSLLGRDEHRWVPTDATHEVLQAIEQALDSKQLLPWLHVCGFDEGIVPTAFENIARLVDKPAQVLKQFELLHPALEVQRAVKRGEVPYFEALASVDMYVEERNAFHDPVSSWRPLIEATEVPVGQRYESPVPIADLALPPGRQPSIDVVVRSHRRGQKVYGMTKAPSRDPLSEPEPLHIRASMRPGQGLARIELASQDHQRFRLSIHEADLTRIDSPPEIRYGWPPGSAWVVSNPALSAPAWRAIRDASTANVSVASLKQMRDTMNTWQRPLQIGVPVNAIRAPEEIHPPFIYLGVFPSHEGAADPQVDEWGERYGDFLVSAYRRGNASVRKATLFCASWLYGRCPEELLEEVRSQLRDLSWLNHAALACAGNCFTSRDDQRLFFSALIESIEEQVGPGNQYWLRAYRNLARFRVESLSNDVVQAEGQEIILDWYLDVFAEGAAFLQCVYLAPHILKRRRFDPEFIKSPGATYHRVQAVYEQARRRATSRAHKDNMQCALKFLESTATTATLQLLGGGENS